ncbi:threonine aldolase family protein [Gluconacetobacter asukensis]|uniref:L-threonine aldolase n=1 Tax=Gluconacetobacter asukensis TaxID=1017181 RepID=A0A7W4J1K1_9PROT|nr:low specificity L-threonine aldolase [Gluconacetobacter asukensis]MBB2173015.1 low specificity L-threonine aldolase [Gluconacetobacter asukensis]
MPHTQQFASDNYAGICPEALRAMEEANRGSAPAYGDDPWTLRAADAFRRTFETDCELFFVFNGTAANSLALASLCQSYESIIAADIAHVETDECGAPEFFSNGAKILVGRTTNGKLTPETISAFVLGRTDIHFPRPKAVTITQPTETGQVYSLDEIRAISGTCRELGLRLHMDGARFANAIETLGCSPAEMTWQAGVDVMSFGGTKNGMAIGEAVIFFDRALAEGFDYRCKQAGQLASKMRFLSAPWAVMFETGAWRTHAAHANACARHFAEQVEGLPEVEIMFPVEANGVFLKLPPAMIDGLHARGWRFYTFIGGSARFMFAWDSEIARIDALAADLRTLATADAA